MNNFVRRTKNSEVFAAWLIGSQETAFDAFRPLKVQNHNGTLRAREDGILEYAGTNIALHLPEQELTGSLNIQSRDYDFVILNPEETTSRTMNKHVFSVIKLLKKKRILIVPQADFQVLERELIGI